MTFPYPGVIKGKEQQNLESVRFKSPVKLIRFEFDFNLKTRQILLLPVNGLIRGLQPIYLSEPFDGSAELRVGITGNSRAFGLYPLNNEGYSVSQDVGDKLMEPRTTPTSVIISLYINSTPTRGRGFGLLEWVNLSLVPRV